MFFVAIVPLTNCGDLAFGMTKPANIVVNALGGKPKAKGGRKPKAVAKRPAAGSHGDIEEGHNGFEEEVAGDVGMRPPTDDGGMLGAPQSAMEMGAPSRVTAKRKRNAVEADFPSPLPKLGCATCRQGRLGCTGCRRKAGLVLQSDGSWKWK